MQNNNSKVFSIVALVCGIVGIIGAWIPVLCYFAFVIAILGIVFGAIGMKKCKAAGERKGLAIAGLVCGIIGTAITLIAVICAVCVVCTAASVLGAAGGTASDLNSLASLLQ
ncbi:MAG: DUF4190 domain-containing protein [Acutalibacteraceae bacterium]